MRRNKKLLFVVTILFGAFSLPELFQRLHIPRHHPDVTRQMTLQRDDDNTRNVNDSVNIILYARYRGGSTFASEFFNRHSDVAFIFEPLCANVADPRGVRVKNVSGVLDSVLRCQYLGKNAIRQVPQFWYRHQMFCMLPGQTPGCSQRVPGGQLSGINPIKAEKYCNSVPHKALKVIRIHQLQELETYMTRGVKVVHLVRDPRGTIHSRRKISHRTNVQSEASTLCEQALRDLAYVRQAYRAGRSEVIDNYYLVRYEDLASEPQQEMQKLYQFLGITPDAALTDWVMEQDGGTKPAGPASSPRQVEQRRSNADRYGTRRQNSSYTAQAWRGSMASNHVTRIQAVCAEFFQPYGYNVIDGSFDIRDMSQSVVKTLDRKAFYGADSIL